ncbi:unnamed protein product [Meloidogyne enterolobii]|uniref:Uncharacterized protein n=1 Tax=Meloidogyne enterolobii TaxID=390850 RepID=A0ACB0Y1A2_MELEN
MGAGLLASQLILVLCFTVYTLNNYAHLRRQRAIIALPTFFGWFFSFLIIIVLPLDVAITFYKKCTTEEFSLKIGEEKNLSGEISIGSHENNGINSNSTSFCEEPGGFIEDKLLFRLWRIVYWGSQFLTWILLPMIQSYAKAGEFNVKGRLKFALHSNAVYYGIYFSLLTFLLIYIVSKGVSLNFASLKILVVSASNTWGIFLLVVLLGYGLIEVPRLFWRMGIPGYRLRRTYFEIDKLSSEKNESEDALLEAYNETKYALNLLKNSRGEAREKIRQISAKFSNDITNGILTSLREDNEGNNSFTGRSRKAQPDLETVSQNAYLVKLHRKVIRAVQTFHRCQIQWNSLLEQSFYLEDVELSERMGKIPKQWTTFTEKNKPKFYGQSRFGGFELPAIPEKIQFFWHCKIKQQLFKFLAILFTFMTTLILWSECTFFISSPQLSLAALLLHGLAKNYHYKFIQICAIAMILYLCICAYYTIFQLRIYRYYRLDSNGMTDENSLIFSAMLICRLTAPMCLNFLGMIHLDSAVTKMRDAKIETQFTGLMGHLEIIPWLAEGINIYLPIVIVLLCFANWFRLGTHFLHYLGIDQFLEDDLMTTEMVNSGRALVSLERNRLVRAANREERNKAWKSSKSGGIEFDNIQQTIVDIPDGNQLIDTNGSSYTVPDNLEFGVSSRNIQYQQLPQRDDASVDTRRENDLQRNFFDDI